MKWITLIFVAAFFLMGCKPSEEEPMKSYKPTADDLSFALGMHMWTIEVPANQPKGSLAIRLSYKGKDTVFCPFGDAAPSETIKFFIWPTGNAGEINLYRYTMDSRGMGGGSRVTRTHEIFEWGGSYSSSQQKSLKIGDYLIEGENYDEKENFRLYLGLNEK